jgi:hypothetical protein
MPDDIATILQEALHRPVGSTVGDLGSFLSPWVAGIEATQAIQYYKSAEHLTDPGDRAPDNSATLAAYKPLMVRAYVNALVDSTVSGTLTVEQGRWRGWRYDYDVVGTYTPWLGAITTQNDTYAAERGSIARTLAFRVPGSLVAGRLRLTVTLDSGHSRSVTVEARLVQTLRVRCIPIHYNGPTTAAATPPGAPRPPTIDLPAPTLADIQTTAASAFAMMPVQPTGSFAMLTQMNWFEPLDDPRTSAGKCSNNWDSLLVWLGLIRDNDGNRSDVVYYGLLPTGMPLGVPGCGSDGLGAGVVGDTTTFVHEIGHGYGFQHTPSGNAGPTDPNYPTYEPYPSASIGAYGLDVRNGTVYSPATSTDYMSYGPNRWMSLYQHERLSPHPRLLPSWISDRNPFDHVPVLVDPKLGWWPDPPWTRVEIVDRSIQPLISVRGFIDESRSVRVDSVARIVGSPDLHGPQTSWSVQLIGRDGAVAARGRVARLETHGGSGCGCSQLHDDPDRLPFPFHALLPDAEPGRALRMLDPDGEAQWERQATEAPVVISEAQAVVREDVLALDWRLSGDADVWAQWSTDEGHTWHGLTVGLKDGESLLPLTGLPAGRVWVRLLAHDGFFTTTTDPMAVEVPEQRPWPAVLYPGNDALVPALVEMDALGSAVDQAGNPIPDERLEWTLDGERLGRGRTATVRAEPGHHRLSLRVIDTEAEHTVMFEAIDMEQG